MMLTKLDSTFFSQYEDRCKSSIFFNIASLNAIVCLSSLFISDKISENY